MQDIIFINHECGWKANIKTEKLQNWFENNTAQDEYSFPCKGCNEAITLQRDCVYDKCSH